MGTDTIRAAEDLVPTVVTATATTADVPAALGGVTAAQPGSAVLDEAVAFLRRFVAFPSPAAADLAALWAMHSHCVGSDGKLLFDSTPRLAYLSDEPGSGKSRALEVTGSLSRRPALIADVTGPAMHTLIANGSSLLIDELDLILGAGDSARPVRACVNAGYRRSGAVARNKGMASVFAPVALAGLATVFTRNPLLAPTKQRAIVITMKPNAGRVELDMWRERLHAPRAADLANSMASWARASSVALVTTFPPLPEGCDDRLADLWEPLMIVAAVAGGSWPDRARAAFGELGSATGSSEPSLPPGLRLLADIRDVWPADVPRMSTADLVAALLAVPGSAWAAAWRDPAAIPRELAALLAPYDVAPRKMRVSQGACPVQGYMRADIEAAIVPDVPAVLYVPDTDEDADADES
jgi:hypothetical protein